MLGKSKEVTHYRDRILRGSIVKTILWLAWPMILANIVNISYNLVDAFWLGKLGKEAFGAPTVSWPLIMLFYSIGMGYASGGISIISQFFGAGDKDMANKSAGQLVLFMGSGALLISVSGVLFSPQVLYLMGVPSDIYPLAVDYIRVIFIGMPLTFMGFAFNTIMNSLGDTRTPTVLNVAAAITNIILDPFLIFGWLGFPRLGVVGAAIATISSRSMVAFIGTILLFKGYRGIKITLRDMRIKKWWLKKIFKIGTPLSIQFSTNALGFTIMMSIVSRFGSAVVAAYGVGIRILDIIQAFTRGVNGASSIMVGQNIGAEQEGRARRIALTSTLILVTSLAIGSLIIYLFRAPVIAVFVNDPMVISEGIKFLGIFTVSIPFFGLFTAAGAIAMGSGHTRWISIISIIRLWVLRIGLSILFALMLGMGSYGIWVAMTISNIGAGLLSLTWILKGKWQKKVV